MSRMKATVRIEEPTDVMVSMTITMSLDDWQLLRGQMEAAAFPSWNIKDAIYDAVKNAEQICKYEKEID